MQDAITKTYSTYGCMFKPGQVAPVGEAFREFQRIAGEEFFTLYNTNGVSDHHASLKGSYVSACVHFSTLYGEPCTGNHFHGALCGTSVLLTDQKRTPQIFRYIGGKNVLT